MTIFVLGFFFLFSKFHCAYLRYSLKTNQDEPFLVDSEPVKIFETSIDEKKVATSKVNLFIRETIVTFHNDQMYEIQVDYGPLPGEDYFFLEDYIQVLVKDKIINSITWLS